MNDTGPIMFNFKVTRVNRTIFALSGNMTMRSEVGKNLDKYYVTNFNFQSISFVSAFAKLLISLLPNNSSNRQIFTIVHWETINTQRWHYGFHECLCVSIWTACIGNISWNQWSHQLLHSHIRMIQMKTFATNFVLIMMLILFLWFSFHFRNCLWISHSIFSNSDFFQVVFTLKNFMIDKSVVPPFVPNGMMRIDLIFDVDETVVGGMSIFARTENEESGFWNIDKHEEKLNKTVDLPMNVFRFDIPTSIHLNWVFFWINFYRIFWIFLKYPDSLILLCFVYTLIIHR